MARMTTGIALAALATAQIGTTAKAEEFYTAPNGLPSTLYRVEWTTGAYVRIGWMGGVEPTDLAVSPTGQLYVCTMDELYTVDVFTAQPFFVGSVSTFSGLVGLEFGTTGNLYACNYTGGVMRLDPGNGVATPLFSLPVNFAGDIAAKDVNTLYGLIEGGNGTELMRIDLSGSGNHANLGTIATNVGFWGLDFDSAGNLIAIAVTGEMYRIPNYTTSGAGVWVSDSTIGAASGLAAVIGGCPAVQNYCTAGTTSHGCNALVSGTGTPSASATSGFTVSVASVEGLQQGIVFYGLDNSNFLPLPWGTGTSFMCVKSPIERMGVLASGGTLGQCDGSYSLDFNSYLANNPSALGAPLGAGQVVFVQAWFRDPPAPKTTNLSNGLRFLLCP
jgi:hypothetical protein